LSIAAMAMFVVDGAIIAVGSDKDVGVADLFVVLLTVAVAAQCACAIASAVMAGRERAQAGDKVSASAVGLSVATVLGAGATWLVGAIAIEFLATGRGGGSMGRPLRVRGRRVEASVGDGDDWTAGPQPDASRLDDATRRALAALWLGDARAEHASVPAFARVSWLLAAAGAPAGLIERAHRAALDEIAHARACFALAAGYGGRSFTVEPMPELASLGARDGDGDARLALAVESVLDGCLVEGFNADLATESAAACDEPVTRGVLEAIARDERGHAELAWAIVDWLVDRHGAAVARSLAEAARALAGQPRPVAVPADARALVAAASEPALRAHGRLADARWAAIWDARVADTRARVAALVIAAEPRTGAPRVRGGLARRGATPIGSVA
jgi:hypothetical protein